jgi:hypothetical protein
VCVGGKKRKWRDERREEKRRGRSGEALRKGKERVMHRGMRRKSQ